MDDLFQMNVSQAGSHRSFYTNFVRHLKMKYQVYLMVFIPFVMFCVFVIYPLFWNLKYSFYQYNGFTAKFIGLYNFKRVLGDPIWWRSVWNTFNFSFGKLIITIPLALIIAVLLNSKLKTRDFLRVVFYLPHIISMAVMSMVFMTMFSAYNGIINEYLMQLGITNAPVDWLSEKRTAMGVVIFISIWKDFGYESLLILAGLQSIPNELYESASIDGAGKSRQFLHITLPQLGPVLQVIVMLAIINSMKVFDLVNVLTGGGPVHRTEVMMTYLFSFYFGTEGTSPQQGYAASVSVVASVVIGIITIAYMFISKKKSQAN